MEDATLLEMLYLVVITGAVIVIYKETMTMILISVSLMTILLVIIRKVTRTRSPVDGKAVLITNCDFGVGLDVARFLRDKNFQVFAAVYSLDSYGSKQLQKLESKNLTLLQIDVTSDTSCDRCLQQITHRLGGKGLWGIVNSIDKSMVRDVELTSIEHYQQIIDYNLLGTIRTIKTFLPLIRHSKGCVVNISSIYGLLAPPLLSAYCASKYGVEGFTESLRLEMKKFEVRVSLVECNLQLSVGAVFNETSENLKVSDEVMETYGEEYVYSSFKSETKDNPESNSAVCEAVTDALINEYYIRRYLVGNSHLFLDLTKVLIKLRGFIPLWWIDNFNNMLHGSKILTDFEKKGFELDDESANCKKKKK